MKHLIKVFILLFSISCFSQGTRLLRQPDINDSQITFCYGSDVWIANINGSNAKRLTSTSAVEQHPYFSPDGKWIAFTSNRFGANAVYVVSVEGGDATRLTWHPNGAQVRGWTNDGKHILYASSRDVAPSSFDRLWTVPVKGGPSTLITKQWSTSGSYSKDGKQMIIDRMSRWDEEWRAYRGGQNTPLVILNLSNSKETLLPNNKTTDIKPIWMGDNIYFLSDRDFVANIWSFNTKTSQLNQVTTFKGSDIKSLSGHNNTLVFERDGYLHTLDINSNTIKQLSINVVGDFPWAATKWEDVSRSARSVSLSPTGKRAIMESRGEIFTVPIENGDSRNMTESSGVADRTPIWSPKGNEVAWFSDKSGRGYELLIANQDGMSTPRSISIGESKLGWEPTWSPDGAHIAFTDDDVRIRVVSVSDGTIKTIDVGGNNLERGRLGLSWSPDSKWLAYSKAGTNNFRQVILWSLDSGKTQSITNPFADAFAPAWDADQEHLYFLASTDVALGSGWANTSAMTANPEYAAYVINLQSDDASPFKPKSDEEEDEKKEEKKEDDKGKSDEKKEDTTIKIDFDNIERRTLALDIQVRNYVYMISGPKGSVFIMERAANSRGLTVQKYKLNDNKAEEFMSGVGQFTMSSDRKKILAQVMGGWQIVDASASAGKGKNVKVDLQMKLDKAAEWKQMFEEAWRYERDYFYDPNMHGRDWNVVYKRYAPLVPYVKHRADLTYILDQVNGELSVGHSFVFGGDYPDVDNSKVGLLGADLETKSNRWQITRIYTTESWNPGLSSPLDQPGLNIKEGHYIVGINGQPLTANDNPFQLLDGALNKQTTLHINDKPEFNGAWKEIVEPIRSENSLRQRTWVEDNRRLVDKLSNGRLAYVWVPNTSGAGFVSFNRYFFAQQDKEGAVIDERFNGGGLLDDYMVDLMTRTLRAGLTNEVPNGKAMRLPAGILGPKALLINELSGSGGDFFPWVFRQQNAGPLIGSTTWGGLVKSSVHYSLIDGGALTAPDNAVFDPINNKWVAENEGVAPDIAVRQDAVALSKGEDPQLERAVKEVLDMLNKQGSEKVVPPPFPKPAKSNN
ncbi:PDZ domain-containing protein [Flavobacteriaceae bacterium S0825]|uniref:S41 family peptidase n=1 Tax=Gaetbulibacter sp. S0825 TaxID=2720084 RepID=UPI001431BCA9|nr:S41 family peptidase [Gaetbulibacter sp. S0825]MCK0108958.1 PDZ domain-containing protein [Flavobacteriaceae bacterium S0825]NIX64593.1 protease [Gaetbulibacter sp. S0825]